MSVLERRVIEMPKFDMRSGQSYVEYGIEELIEYRVSIFPWNKKVKQEWSLLTDSFYGDEETFDTKKQAENYIQFLNKHSF